MRILFQGDSITDCGRDRRDFHNMGNGYPKYSSELIREAFPAQDFEFINLGIDGTRTNQLFDRFYPDAIALQPDIISILIGINDIWHRYNRTPVLTTDRQTEANYRAMLELLKEKTNAKIIMLSPFLLDDEKKEAWRPELNSMLPFIRSLADEFADVYIPLDKLFDEARKTQPSLKFYSDDGVHPNLNGIQFIAKHYSEAIKPLIQEVASQK